MILDPPKIKSGTVSPSISREVMLNSLNFMRQENVVGTEKKGSKREQGLPRRLSR